MSIFPDPSSVLSSKEEIRRRLDKSLNHLVFEAAEDQNLPEIVRDRLDGLLYAQGQFPSCAVFAAHAAMLKAALKGDAARFAWLGEGLARFVTVECVAPSQTSVTPLSDLHFSLPALEILRTAFEDDIGLTENLGAPDAAESTAATDIIHETLEAAARHLPVWHDEFLALVSQVLLSVPDAGSAKRFGGASTFDAFGAILINPRHIPTHEAALMSLVHESSHQRLFLYHLDDPVLLNDAEPRYRSPLRREPRPMEGVFHAVWVSARMALAADELLRASAGPDWAERLEPYRNASVAAVLDGVPTIEANAEFTSFGKGLFDDMRDALGGLSVA